MSQTPAPDQPPRPHRGAVILTLGIIGLAVCYPIGPVAWIMGEGDLRAMDAGRMDPQGRGLTQAGRTCGIIGTVLLILAALMILLNLSVTVVTSTVSGP